MVATFPDLSRMTKTPNGWMVASAEQGFIQLFFDGKVKQDTRYVSVSPCVRACENDKLHFPVFMKVELSLWTKSEEKAHLEAQTFLKSAKRLLEHRLTVESRGSIFLKAVSAPSKYGIENTDLMLDGIELGSYGYRRLVGGNYIVYGTGLAEPRTTQALAIQKKKNEPLPEMVEAAKKVIRRMEEEGLLPKSRVRGRKKRWPGRMPVKKTFITDFD